jgi:hypothetical protein
MNYDPSVFVEKTMYVHLEKEKEIDRCMSARRVSALVPLSPLGINTLYSPFPIKPSYLNILT